MLNGVIAQKLETLEQILAELDSLGQITVEELDDWRIRRAVERDLQILVEVVIDICQRVISLAGQTPATTSVMALERCIELGAVSDDLAYRQMVRFRNFIVHRYEQVDLTILTEIINVHLVKFAQFQDEVLAYVQQAG